VKAFLLAAGRGTRFLPVTNLLPKPLFPFLNVPLIRAHLARLAAAGVQEAGLNLHHRGGQIVRELSERASDLPKLRFFEEPAILGTAGGLRNAAELLSGGDFLVVNTDAAIEADFRALAERHRDGGHAVTLLLAENLEPERFTPVAVDGDRVTGFGGQVERPFLYAGVFMMSAELLSRIPEGFASLVPDLWEPLLREMPGGIGWLHHRGSFTDLGRPGDFLRATLEALERGGPFPNGAGDFDVGRRVLALLPPSRFEARASVLGDVRIGRGAVLEECAIWSGARIGDGARLRRVVVAGGEVAEGADHEEALLWGEPGRPAAAFPLGGT
jgi:NDP-sugar pyrophosphorylase family protein